MSVTVRINGKKMTFQINEKSFYNLEEQVVNHWAYI